MKGRVGSIALGCVLAAFLAGTAAAQPRIMPPSGGGGGGGAAPAPSAELIRGTTLEITQKMLQEAGYTDVEIYAAQSGRKHVSGKTQGVLVSAIHMFCNEQGACPAVGYMVNFGAQDSIDAKYMNAWNEAKLYGRLYKIKDGTLFLQQDVMVYDVSPAYIKHTAQMFGRLIKDLLEFKPPEN